MKLTPCVQFVDEDANGLISYGDADHRQDYLVANGYVNLDANHALAEGIRSTTRQGDIVNDLVINYKNNFGTSYTYTDQTSIDAYGLYARTINSLIDDDPDAQAVAERFVTFRSTPKSKFDSITYALQNPELSDANRDDLLNVFMGMPVAIGSYWAGDLSAHQEAFNEALVASMKVVGQEGARDRKLFAQLTGRLLDPRLEELRRADRANADQRQGLGDPLATALDRARAARRTQDVVIDAEFETKEGGHHG